MLELFDAISQFGIVIFGLSAIFLVAKKNKWGFVIGMISQPFWFYTSWYHKQWGAFLLSFAYLLNWVFGIYEWFYKDPIEPAKKAAK